MKKIILTACVAMFAFSGYAQNWQSRFNGKSLCGWK